MITTAYMRKSLIEDDNYLASSIELPAGDWQRLEFKYMQLDGDEQVFSEKDHPDGYNMILLHPETYQLFWAYSSEFDFKVLLTNGAL